MSSDESTSTQLSVVSSQGSVALQNKLKRHSAQYWEIELIGNFLLSLYHRSLINPQSDWLCKKRDIRQEYEKHLSPQIRKRFKDACGTDNIGALLHHCGFLTNTPRGSHYYQLKSKELFEFRNKELKRRDRSRLRSNGGANFVSESENETEKANLIAFDEVHQIDEDSPEHKLEYQGTTMVQRKPNFYPTNNSCCICQLHFTSMDSYEEHIQKHNDENDFEYLKELSQFDSPIFRMSYRLCKNSHYFCFNINSDTTNIVIEKIIVIQSRSMFYVHDMRVPYELQNGSEQFYVDSHLFTLFVEQPIILISYLKDSENTRIIEEHHFVRTTELPKVNFQVKPYRLPSYKLFKPASKLLDFFPPIEVRNALRDDFIYEKLMQTSNEFRDYIRNEKILQPQTIGPTLRTLLHVEDMDTIKEYVNLLQHNVTLRHLGDSYSFKITPKSRIFVENILSTFDDILLTTRSNITADSEGLIKLILTQQEDMKGSGMTLGRIEDVNSGRITFRTFSKLDAKRTYTVIFRPSRLTLRYQYRALELLPAVMPYLKKFLFPGPLIPQEPSTISLQLYNKSIYSNPEQLQAVRNIAEGPRNDATYIIFGPPGTGKTTTLVESILQVIKRNGTKVLVTASSNSACDEIALRLCENLKTFVVDMARVIVRVYAQSNESRIDTIDDLLIEHSNLYSGNHFYPDVEILHEYRIVVCTMSVVAKLACGKFGRRENGSTLFTHLFIDEVAASTEVEALMPITTALTPKACLIIAGDHKQLGPVLKSKRAEEFRLGQSLMERLLKRECYRVNTDTGHYDRSVQTRLRLNFRSHPHIVNLYSAMYYNHDLEAKANIDDVSLIKDWHAAPSKDYPIIFHSVKGRSFADKTSFSLYNSEEVNIVMDYVKDLMYFGINGKPVNESDIGIISPYKKQHLRIREELSLRKWYMIETGSVENFQGREKTIIIVSFVRSGTPTLGFLESPNRLNVTLSRAKSLLIMVGNVHTLCMNPDFDHIIKECKRHQTLIGDVYNYMSGQAPEVPFANSSENVSTLDPLNRSLSDLNLNNNRNPQQGNRANGHSRRPLKNSNKENKNADNGKNDDKPSTSSTAKAKQYPSRSQAKPYTTDKRNIGKVKAKDTKKESINLDSYFDGLPKVPMAATTMIPDATNKKPSNSDPKQKPIVQQNGILPMPPMAQTSQYQQQGQQMPFYYPTQTQPMPPPQYVGMHPMMHPMQPNISQQKPPNMTPQQLHQYNQQLQMQQQLQHRQQQQLQQQHHQQQQLQQHQRQQHLQQLQQQQQQQQQQQILSAAFSSSNLGSPSTSQTSINKLPDDLSEKLTTLNLRKDGCHPQNNQSKRKNKQLKNANNEGSSNANNLSKPKEENQAKALKVAENQNFSSHSKEGKTASDSGSCQNSSSDDSNCYYAREDKTIYQPRTPKSALDTTNSLSSSSKTDNPTKANNKTKNQNQQPMVDKKSTAIKQAELKANICGPVSLKATKVPNDKNEKCFKKKEAPANKNNANTSSLSSKNLDPSSLDSLKPLIMPSNESSMANALPHLTGAFNRPISSNKNTTTISSTTTKTKEVASSLLSAKPQTSTSLSELKTPTNTTSTGSTANNNALQCTKETATSTQLNGSNAKESLYPSLSFASARNLHPLIPEGNICPSPAVTKTETHSTPTNSSTTNSWRSSKTPSLTTSHPSSALNETNSKNNLNSSTSELKRNNHPITLTSSSNVTSWRSAKTPSSATSDTSSTLNQTAVRDNLNSSTAETKRNNTPITITGSSNMTTSHTSSALNETNSRNNLNSSTTELKCNNHPITLASSSNVTSWRSAKTPSSATSDTSSTLNQTAVRDNLNSSAAETKRNNTPITITGSSNMTSLRSSTTTSSTTSYTSNALNQTSLKDSLNSTSQATQSHSALSNVRRPIHGATKYDSNALNQTAARENVYAFSSQATRSNNTFSNGSRPVHTDNNAYHEGAEALNYNHFSRPTRNLNFDNASAGQRQNSNRNDKSDSKCTIA